MGVAATIPTGYRGAARCVLALPLSGTHPVRVPVDLLSRADALAPGLLAVREIGLLAGGRVSRAAVVRLALSVGLDELTGRAVSA